MKLSMKTVAAILDRWSEEGIVTDYCGEYGEPGYEHDAGAETPLVVLGDYWCQCGKVLHAEGHPREGEPALHDHAHHLPRLWARLEEQGVQFEWHDEWIVDYESDKAYRTQPDSYSWQSSVVLDEDGEWLTPDSDLDAWLVWAVNDSSRALPSIVWSESDLKAAGFVKHNGQYENGWHPGQDDDPRAITDAIREEHGEDVEIVFLIDGTGQFDIAFSAYYRGAEGSDCPRCGGTGEVDYEHRESCSQCGGTGQVTS